MQHSTEPAEQRALLIDQVRAIDIIISAFYGTDLEIILKRADHA